VLEPPKAGPVLVHVATIAVPIEGQAFAFDHNSDNRIAYGIVRSEKQVIVFRVPEIPR